MSTTPPIAAQRTAPSSTASAGACWHTVRADLYRVGVSPDVRGLLTALVTVPATRFLVNYRLGAWARRSPRRRVVVVAVTAALYQRLSVRLNLEIPFTATIGPGLRLLHTAGGVIVNPKAVIGSNCTLGSGVTVVGRLGDGVAVAAGSFVRGTFTVGDGARIGANSVVCADVAPGTVVAGAPARVLEGSRPHQVGRTDWADVIGPRPVAG